MWFLLRFGDAKIITENKLRACLDWGEKERVKGSRVELTGNILILDLFYSTLPPSPSMQTELSKEENRTKSMKS